MAIQCDFVCQNLVKGKEKRKRKIRIKGGETGALLKGDFLAQLFSCEFCEIFQNTCNGCFSYIWKDTVITLEKIIADESYKGKKSETKHSRLHRD